MRNIVHGGLSAAALILLTAGVASAWHLTGHVVCAGTGLPLSGFRVDVVSTDANNPFAGSGTTDDAGSYTIALLDVPTCYHATGAGGQGDAIVTPASGDYQFCTTEGEFEIVRDWVVDGPSCANTACWLTGGGAKFFQLTGTNLGDYVKAHNWGGNVNPGCSPTAGDGGSWNDIDNLQRLHFHGTHIEVIRCGNVDGIPPGSTSPATPFNFIEFQGFGTLKGIKGNKADFGTVYFFGRCEDRNEPGSSGQRDGNGKDRYFLNVYTDSADPVGSSVLLVDQDGNPATVDPVIITDGNLQIHVSSCSTPPVGASRAVEDAPASPIVTGSQDAGELAWLAPGFPNPSGERASFRFGMARGGAVSLRVYDASGRVVRELLGGSLPSGRYTSVWDLTDRTGRRVAGGVYFVRLDVAGVTRTRAMAVIH